MEKRNRDKKERNRLPDILPLGAACILLLLLSGYILAGAVLPEQFKEISRVVILVAEGCLLLLSVRLTPGCLPLELKLLRQGAFWLFAAQIITERLGWGLFRPLTMAVLMPVCGVLGYLIYRERRWLLLHITTAIWCLLLGCCCVCGLLGAFTNEVFAGTGVQASTLQSGLYNLAIFGHSGEAVACFLTGGIGILLMQCLSVRGLFWKVLTLLLLPEYLLVLLMEKCVSAYVAVSVMVAFLLAELLYGVLGKTVRILPRTILTILAIVIVTAGCLGGQLLGSEFCNAALTSQTTVEEPETGAEPETAEEIAIAAASEETPSEETAPQPAIQSMAAQAQDGSNGEPQPQAPAVAMRRNWQEIPGELAGYPQGALFGIAPSPETEPAHDLPLQQFWQGGLPLLLMSLTLVFWLLFRMVRVFFDHDNEVSGQAKLLAALMLGLAVLYCTMPLMEEDYYFTALIMAFFVGGFMMVCEASGVQLPKQRAPEPVNMYNPQRLHTNRISANPPKPEDSYEQARARQHPADNDFVPEWMLEHTPEIDLDFMTPDSEYEEENEEAVNPNDSSQYGSRLSRDKEEQPPVKEEEPPIEEEPAPVPDEPQPEQPDTPETT